MKNNLRYDLQIIGNIVSAKSKVLEIGCGKGELLKYLEQTKDCDCRGIDLDQSNVSKAVELGLSVIQGDVDNDLKIYPDNCFEYVISSQVLQATKAPKEVFSQLLRVSKKVIISIPNFGNWRNRYYLAFKGKMPVTKTLSYQWYETPNIHFCTISDFEQLCSILEAKVEKKIYLNKNKKQINAMAKAISYNLFAEKAVFVISR